MTKKIIIGLTGPIASGKSMAAKMLARHGAFVIDADVIGHQVIAPQSKAWHEIVKAFGLKVLNRGGAVNRRKLARIVFSRPSSLKKLDKITHPEMRRIISAKIKLAKISDNKAFASGGQGCRCPRRKERPHKTDAQVGNVQTGSACENKVAKIRSKLQEDGRLCH
jgi:hypothetical protein